MSTDEYVPTDEDFIDSWACAHVTPHDMTAEEAKDAARAFLARVRREAKAEAWDEAHEIGWNNADEYWRCDGLIPSYWKADTYPNPYRETGDSDEPR